jgi:putative ABC transport system permease protein
MTMGKQILAVTLLNLKSLPSRFWSSLVIVVGMTCAIGVLVSMLSLVTGYVQSQMKAGDPGRAIILASGIEDETQSTLTRDKVNFITDAPGIRKDSDGAPLAEGEIVIFTPVVSKDGVTTFVLTRGFGPEGLRLRPELKMVLGRVFRPGTRDMIVGKAAQGQFAGLEIGDTVTSQGGAQWRVVGVFATGGDTLEGQLIVDRDTLMAAGRRTTFNNVLARLDDAPGAMDVLKKARTGNPALSVIAERHSDYYQHLSGPNVILFAAVAYMTGGIMALGAMFGALNIMYAAVSARTGEIGTLRALGFGALPVAISVVSECLFLALTGTLLGSALAWLLFNGSQRAYFGQVFNLTVTPGLIGLGITWALAIALLGSSAPAIRAARLPIVDALRAI